MIDGAALAVSGGDSAVNETLVQGQVWERSVQGQPVAATGRGSCAVISLRHDLCGVSGDAGSSARLLLDDAAQLAHLEAVSGWSVTCLPVWLSAGSFMLRIDVTGWPGGPRNRVRSGQAKLCRPALDVRPEPVALVQVSFAGGVGQDHRSDGGEAVHDLAGQPGHFPFVLAAGRLPGRVAGLVAALDPGPAQSSNSSSTRISTNSATLA